MNEKIVLEKEWIKKYKELKIELSLIEEEIRGIEDYSVLFLDEIVSLDREIKSLETEKEQINNLPKEIKEIKKLMIEGTIVSLLAASSLSVFLTPNLDELTKENLIRILSKFSILAPVFETLIMVPSVKEILLLKKKMNHSNQRLLEIEKEIEENHKNKNDYSNKRNSDLDIIESLKLDKNNTLLEICEHIKLKYPDENITQEEIKKYLTCNNFEKVLASNSNEYNINMEKILLKKIN